MKYLILMLQFFTRIPLPFELKVDTEDFPKGIKYFPLVGLILGGLSLGVFRLLSLGVATNLALGLTCLFNVLITGALHLDGLADTCDGLFSARSKEKMLEIMRDSRIGTNGALALFFDLALRLILLIQLQNHGVNQALLLAPLLGRSAMVGLIFTCPPARTGSGMGNLFIGKTRWPEVVAVGLIATGITAGCLGYHAVNVLGFNLAGIWLYRNLVMAKIGGMTGDTLGAANEVSEILTLLAMATLK